MRSIVRYYALFILFIISVLNPNSLLAIPAVEIKTTCVKYEILGRDNGPGNKKTYNGISKTETSSQVGDVLTVVITVDCLFPGDNLCIGCDLLGNNTTYGTDPIDYGYVNDSNNMMDEYVTAQVAIGNYSGYSSFNQLYNGKTWYRNASWQGDSLNVTKTFYVIPSLP
jgi:hypothetical protein